MKSKILMSGIVVAVLICSCTFLNAFDRPEVHSNTIIGTWLSETDSQWKMVFTKNKCYQYYGATLIETDSYLISNTSPQCGEVVPIENSTSYLKLTDDQGSTTVTCYEIIGITSVNLSIRPVNSGKIFVLVRQ